MLDANVSDHSLVLGEDVYTRGHAPDWDILLACVKDLRRAALDTKKHLGQAALDTKNSMLC